MTGQVWGLLGIADHDAITGFEFVKVEGLRAPGVTNVIHCIVEEFGSTCNLPGRKIWRPLMRVWEIQGKMRDTLSIRLYV